jgi:uncharacterized Zn-binding protein involved in type VI secretion
MFPAARKGDPITHDLLVPSGTIGPPLSGPCPMEPVIIEGLPAAHVNCTVICSGVISGGAVHPPPPGPPPPIMKGSLTVLIHGMPAARWAPSGDIGACTVQLGDPKLIATRTVFIGDIGAGPQALQGRTLNFSQRQLQKKFKHATDFGISGDYNPVNAAKFQATIEAHVANANTRILPGIYRGKLVTHYVHPQTGLNVVKDATGQFHTGWRLSPAQIKYVLSTGKLGGG